MKSQKVQTSPYSIANIRLFIAFRIFFNARFYYPVFTILFLDFGLTIEQFALLNTVWAITIVLAEVPSGALADILGRKYLIVTTSLLMVLEMCLLAFVPLGSSDLIFYAFLLNRILSGLAEAMASGADEAIAYDSLIEQGHPDQWSKVLSLQLRMRSIASFITMTVGALIYDPNVVNRILSWFDTGITVDQQVTMRFPIYLTLVLAILATATALRMEENSTINQGDPESSKTVAALKKTWEAGLWIARTPFALTIILFGMFYDHVLRMIVTMTSQYFRLINLPEASFGIIGSVLGLLGLITPKIAEKMAATNTPVQNMYWITGISLLAILGLTGFYPYWGLLPMGLLFCAMMFVSFFSSHYLNKITESHQRATVLSFKGLAFNLAYGLIGVFFAVLINSLRSDLSQTAPHLTTIEIENGAFIAGIGWFPGYFVLCLAILLVFTRYQLRHTKEHKQTHEAEK